MYFWILLIFLKVQERFWLIEKMPSGQQGARVTAQV